MGGASNMAGLESLVQNKMQTFRGNPAQAEQPIQLDQQLVELIALQKLKSDKEAAARDIQIKMAQSQGTPQTIMQQRETEMLGQTRNEVAQQVGATGQQQAAEQQAMIQSLMGASQGGGGSPQGGGIASFADGGKVRRTGDPIADNEMESRGILEVQENPGWIQRFIKRAREVNERQRARNAPKGRTYGSGPLPASGGLAALYPEQQEEPMAAETPEMQPVDIDTIINAPESTRARMQDTGIAPPELPYEAGLSTLINSRLDPNFSRNRAAEERATASEYLGVPPERQEQLKGYQDQLAALDARQMDPKKLQRQRLAAFLISAGRGHNLGAGLGLGGGASAQVRGEQETAERSRLMERQGVADKIADMNAESRAGIYNAGAAAGNAVENQVSTAMNAAAQERRNLMDAEQKQLDREQEAELEQSRTGALRALEEFKAGQGSKDQAIRLIIAAQANYDARLAGIMESSKMLGTDPTPELAALEDKYEPIFEEARSLFGGAVEDMGGFTVRPK